MTKESAGERREPTISGVCPVLETPFTKNGDVDYNGFVAIVDHVVAAGVRAVMFPGFASEHLKLSDSERASLSEALLERTRDVRDFVPVISVPEHSLHLAQKRAVNAVAQGARCINVLPPHLLSPSAPAVRAHIHGIADGVYPTPVIVQYAPSQTGTTLDASTLSLMSRQSPNITQVKVESTPPGALVGALLDREPALSSVVGYGGVQLIDALRRGAVGVQPGCSFVELYLHVWDAWHSGDREAAEELHSRMLPYLSYWMQGVELIVAAEKRISLLRGLIKSDRCREPGYALDREEGAMIERFLCEFGEELDHRPADVNGTA